MKKFFLLTLAIVFNISLFAQNQQNPVGGSNRQQFTPEARAERLAEQLELTAEQKAKVLDLYKTQAEQREKNRNNSELSPEKRRELFEEMRKIEDTELEKIIGKEKMELYLKLRAEREQRWREGGGSNRQRNN